MFKRIVFLTVLFTSLCLSFFQNVSYAKVRQGEVTFKITIDAPENSRDVRVWIPYPVSDKEQTIEDVKIDGNFSKSGVYSQKEKGDMSLYAEWKEPAKERYITLTFKAKAVERIKKDFPKNIPLEESGIPAEIKEFVKGSQYTPTDGRIKEIAMNVTRGKKGILEKAEAVYDWVIENTYRDPNVQGCGIGDVERMLTIKGGKCADISGVYVAIARAAGVPARDVFGLRLGKKPEDDITGGHHCWAEFYLPGYGWVPADPADVRKAMLEKGLDLKQAKQYRDYYFGAVDEYRIALTRGAKGYTLNPPQKGVVIPYGFMYPYAEIDGKPVEWLAAHKELKYKIAFKEIKDMTISEKDY